MSEASKRLATEIAIAAALRARAALGTEGLVNHVHGQVVVGCEMMAAVIGSDARHASLLCALEDAAANITAAMTVDGVLPSPECLELTRGIVGKVLAALAEDAGGSPLN